MYEKICPCCGEIFFAFRPDKKFCSPQCADRYHYKKKSKPPSVIPVDRTFDDWIREADECNLDYGTYRGLIKMGKTFEELKATADRRAISVHAHGGAVSKKNYRD